MFASARTGMLAIGATAAFALLATTALAETMNYKVALKGSAEVPANTTTGIGNADLAYDTVTKKLTWTVTYSGLTGPATAAHFHSPASITENAPPTVPLMGSLESPIKGEATLTAAQAADFTSGKMYFNIHTAANPNGEIRGQIDKAVGKD
jgi:hypothetical protein